ncbi:MAG: ABC transporter substrate-binding protein [Parabacteroides sp.]|nr:ABC transporter substrate-binding protein [Parabacteroides sp.]
MKYFLPILIFLITSCKHITKENDNSEISVAVLRGPSALAFAEWADNPPVIDGDTFHIRWIDSPEIMQSLLIKQEVDIAVLPMINAANLYNKNLPYHLSGCPIWGTLYAVSRDSLKAPVYVFGRGTTPEILAKQSLADFKDEDFRFTFSSAGELTQALLSGRVNSAVLSEPFISIAMNKDKSLEIVADLNCRKDKSSYGFPQTAIVCHKELSNKREIIDSLLTISCNSTAKFPEKAIKTLEKEKVFAKNTLDSNSVMRCRISYKPASQIKDEVNSFLELIYKYEPKALGNKMPDNNFFIEE